MTVPTSEQQKWNPAQLDNGTLTVVPIPHQRVWDLLRQMRGHLSDEGLISMREYAWIASEAPGVNGAGSPAPRRLESYDEMKARLDTIDELKAALLRERAQHQWQPIETAPNETDVLVCADGGVGEARCHGREGWWWAGNDPTDAHGCQLFPQFWMPLPPKPLAEPQRAEPRHVCGLSGYNGHIDPPCPACDAATKAREQKLAERAE